MYDKKKTLSSYMGGGYMNPMGYATGGYIPGLSRSRFTSGLQRDSRIAQEEFEEQAKKLEKEQYWRGIGKTLGKIGGTALGALLAAPTGGLSIAAGKALGATLGTAAGGAIGGSGQDASNIKDSSTGLYKDDFEYLRDQGRKAESFKRLGQESAIAGGTTYLGAKSGDIVSGGKKFIGDKFGVESLENLGLAGKTEPLFSSLNQDVAKAKAGAEFVIGDLDMQRLPLDFASTTDYDAELAMLFDEIAGQEQAGQNIVGGGVLNLNKGGMVQQYQNGGMYNGYKDGGRITSSADPYDFGYDTPDVGVDQSNQIPFSMSDLRRVDDLKELFESVDAEGRRYKLSEKGLSGVGKKRKNPFRIINMDSMEIGFVNTPKKEEQLVNLPELLKMVTEQNTKDQERKEQAVKKDRLTSLLSYAALFGLGVNKSGVLKGFQKGGKIKEYGHGGLIDMKQFGRRIL